MEKKKIVILDDDKTIEEYYNVVAPDILSAEVLNVFDVTFLTTYKDCVDFMSANGDSTYAVFLDNSMVKEGEGSGDRGAELTKIAATNGIKKIYSTTSQQDPEIRQDIETAGGDRFKGFVEKGYDLDAFFGEISEKIDGFKEELNELKNDIDS